MTTPGPFAYRFPSNRPEDDGPDEHIWAEAAGLDWQREAADQRRRIAIWDEGYELLSLWQKLRLYFGLDVWTTTFHVEIYGPDKHWGVHHHPPR